MIHSCEREMRCQILKQSVFLLMADERVLVVSASFLRL